MDNVQQDPNPKSKKPAQEIGKAVDIHFYLDQLFDDNPRLSWAEVHIKVGKKYYEAGRISLVDDNIIITTDEPSQPFEHDE